MAEIITMIGLWFDIVGVVLLFWHSPENSQTPSGALFLLSKAKPKGVGKSG